MVKQRIRGGTVVKGIVLAGGSGTRLHPITKAINKHLLPVGKYPMIFYPLAKLHQAGIEQVLVVTNKEQIGNFVNLLGSGKEFEMEFTYKVQEQPGGIAQALSLAATFVGSERCLVILGDNLFSANLGPAIQKYQKQPAGAKVFLKKVSDPQRYAIAELQNGRVVRIEEKPLSPRSDWCVTGIYLYDSHVFEIIAKLKPSGRKELEITDVNNVYLREENLSYEFLDGWWTDAGTFEALQQANEYTINNDLKNEWPVLSTGSLRNFSPF